MVDSINLLQLQDCDGSDDEFEKRVERVIEEYQQKRAASQVDLAVADLQKLLNGQLVIAHQLIANHHCQVLAAVKELLKSKEETIKRLKDERDRNQHRSADHYAGKSAGTGESPNPLRRENSKITPTVDSSESNVPGSLKDEGAWTQPSAPPPRPRLSMDSIATDASSVTAITQYTAHDASPKVKGRKREWHNWGGPKWKSAMPESGADSEELVVRKSIAARETLRHSVSCNVFEAQQKARSGGQNVKMLEGKSEANGVFVDAQAMKERVKEAIMKPDNNVANLYKKSGIWQKIARSNFFDNTTLFVIGINALWIAADTDVNDEATLLTAHLVFVVAENFFCLYFTGELLIRFMAFNYKRDIIKDYWFMFDSGLVLLMVIETWIVTLVLWLSGNDGGGSGMGNASILRIVRLLRLTRMARMARLLRAMPELMILVKGVVVATRSVFFTLCLLVIIIYVFAIAFTQLAEEGVGPVIQEKYFDTVFDSMNTLLLRGILPDLAETVNVLGEDSYLFATLFLFFILLSSLTVMNMLVGVLVEVVKVVSSVEKEQMTIQFVKTKLQSMLDICNIDADGNQYISKDEFEALLLQPAAARIIQEVGVDVVGLVDFADFIFQDGIELSFPEFLEVVLQLRGTNGSTVRDIVDLRKFFLTQLQESTVTMMESFSDNLKMQFKVEGAEMTKQVSKTMVTALEAEIRHVKAWPRPNDNRSLNGNNDNNNEKSVKFGAEEKSTALATRNEVTPADMTPFAGSRSRSNSPNMKKPQQRPQRSHSPRVRHARRPWSGNVKVTESVPPDQGSQPIYQQTPLPAFPHMWVEDIDASTTA